MDPKRILITGPESTGKSNLSKALSKHYRSLWNPEYAREFLAHKSSYSAFDLDLILKKQLELEADKLEMAHRYLFCDTGPEVIKIWSDYKYQQSSEFIEKTFREHTYDFTLLLFPDLPWEPDPLRENPSEEERKELFEMYYQLLHLHQRPFAVIKGQEKERAANAIIAIDDFFNE